MRRYLRSSQTSRAWSAAWLGLAFLACAPESTIGGPGPGASGNAQGSAASGEYDIETLTTACAGTCGLTYEGGFVVSVCDVGARNRASATIVQTDGHLQVDSEDSDYISRAEGSLDANGAFNVSGTRTMDGGGFIINIHAVGNILDSDADATLAGTVDGRVTGSRDGRSLDCHMTAEVTGERVATPE